MAFLSTIVVLSLVSWRASEAHSDQCKSSIRSIARADPDRKPKSIYDLMVKRAERFPVLSRESQDALFKDLDEARRQIFEQLIGTRLFASAMFQLLKISKSPSRLSNAIQEIDSQKGELKDAGEINSQWVETYRARIAEVVRKIKDIQGRPANIPKETRERLMQELKDLMNDLPLSNSFITSHLIRPLQTAVTREKSLNPPDSEGAEIRAVTIGAKLKGHLETYHRLRSSVEDHNFGLARDRTLYWKRGNLARRVNATNDFILQAALDGLMTSAENYDFRLGYSFSTYAYPAIDTSIRRDLQRLRSRLFGNDVISLSGHADSEDNEKTFEIQIASDDPEHLPVDRVARDQVMQNAKAEWKRLYKWLTMKATDLVERSDVGPDEKLFDPEVLEFATLRELSERPQGFPYRILADWSGSSIQQAQRRVVWFRHQMAILTFLEREQNVLTEGDRILLKLIVGKPRSSLGGSLRKRIYQSVAREFIRHHPDAMRRLAMRVSEDTEWVPTQTPEENLAAYAERMFEKTRQNLGLK